MKRLPIALIIALGCTSIVIASSQHLMEGPYDYDERGKPQPRFYTLDGKVYASIDHPKSTISHVPAGSRVQWQGGCQPYSAVELGPRPYMSLSAFRRLLQTASGGVRLALRTLTMLPCNTPNQSLEPTTGGCDVHV